MRDIKFRAWDRRENVMRSVQALFSNGHVYVYCSCDEEGQFIYHRDKKKTGLPHHLNGNDVVLMQNTGLNDKNGKEIYEGDIVEFEDDVRLSIQWAWNSYNFYGQGAVDWDITNHDPEKDFEIIGNIYENPDLLTSASAS